MPPVEPAEIVIHGDFARYNCVLQDGNVAGVFDFDTAHPAYRLWDVAALAEPANALLALLSWQP